MFVSDIPQAIDQPLFPLKFHEYLVRLFNEVNSQIIAKLIGGVFDAKNNNFKKITNNFELLT